MTENDIVFSQSTNKSIQSNNINSEIEINSNNIIFDNEKNFKNEIYGNSIFIKSPINLGNTKALFYIKNIPLIIIGPDCELIIYFYR